MDFDAIPKELREAVIKSLGELVEAEELSSKEQLEVVSTFVKDLLNQPFKVGDVVTQKGDRYKYPKKGNPAIVVHVQPPVFKEGDAGDPVKFDTLFIAVLGGVGRVRIYAVEHMEFEPYKE